MEYKSYLSVALIFSAFLGNSHAQLKSQPNSHYQAPITIVSEDNVYQVNEDYSYTQTQTKTLRLNSQVGVHKFSQVPISYNPDLDTLEVIEAYTTKPNGDKVKVDPKVILDRQSSASADAPMFNSDRVKTIVFPDTAIGDTLTFKVKGTSKPLFPNSFSASILFPPVYDIDHATVTIDIPESMKLYTDNLGLKEGEKVQQNGRTTWTWTLEKQKGLAPEPAMAMTTDNIKAIFATTFANEQQAADAYWSRAKDKVHVSDDIQQQADAITKGIKDKKAQAEAIYNWVSQNIRYVAVYFGAGGVVPHSADEILKNRYGDCKDHVVLLEALLAAKGIASEPVLINAQAFYGVPKVMALPGIFDHAITYLPDYDLYLDSTAEVATFGVLPPTENGKPVLRVNQKAAILTTLPVSTPQDNHVSSKIEINLNDDGSAQGKASISQNGEQDWIARMITANIPKGMESQVAQKFLQMSGQSGSGNYQFGQPRQLEKPFEYHSEFTLSDVFEPDSEGAFRVPLGIGSLSGINPNTFGPLTSIATRQFSFALNGGSIKSVTHLHLPETLNINKLPQDTTVNNILGSYQAHYEQQGQEIIVTRTLTIVKKAPVTASTDYKYLQALNDAINKDLRKQIFYSMKAK